MSLNIAPVYGKQYIRYAETWEAAADKEGEDPSGNLIGTVELLEFAVVTYATYAGPNKVCAPGDLVAGGDPLAVVGVNQAYIPTALDQPHTARQASVATSGSLIVAVSPEATTPFTLNGQLSVAEDGRALPVADGGVVVTVDGTTPLIREIVEIGGRTILIVSFN